MRTRVVIGSRGSRLALIQAEAVASALRQASPHVEVSIRQIVTEGDRDSSTQLHQMAGEGVFVKELEKALLDGTIDLAVHSLKDMPTQLGKGLHLAAVTERADPRDVFVSASGRLSELAPGSRIGTDSLRRAVQLRAYRPDLEVLGIRGNVDTRLRKVSRGEFDGVMLAAAGMLRLGWGDRITEYLPVEHFLPSVGQGALGMEIRDGDREIDGLASWVSHRPTWQSVSAERAFLRAVGGGCRAPIAALATADGDTLVLKGMIADPGGRKLLYAEEKGSALAPEHTGAELARKMFEMGASELLSEARTR